MGEYATTTAGERIKIGTDGDMWYLRHDQLGDLVDFPHTIEGAVRFRFPFPDEDHVAPGAFVNPQRHQALHVDVPADVDHATVQFEATAGFNVMPPCPLSPEGKASGLPFHANGFPGRLHIRQQQWWNGRLVLVCACGACGSRFFLPDATDALPVLQACQRESASRHGRGPQFWLTVAERIQAGYRIGERAQDPASAPHD